MMNSAKDWQFVRNGNVLYTGHILQLLAEWKLKSNNIFVGQNNYRAGNSDVGKSVQR